MWQVVLVLILLIMADSTLSTKLYGGMYELMPETKEALESFVNYGYSLGG